MKNFVKPYVVFEIQGVKSWLQAYRCKTTLSRLPMSFFEFKTVFVGKVSMRSGNASAIYVVNYPGQDR